MADRKIDIVTNICGLHSFVLSVLNSIVLQNTKGLLLVQVGDLLMGLKTIICTFGKLSAVRRSF